jgi:hypothetical protein
MDTIFVLHIISAHNIYLWIGTDIGILEGLILRTDGMILLIKLMLIKLMLIKLMRATVTFYACKKQKEKYLTAPI